MITSQFEEWLKKATIEELLDQFEIRCYTISEHEINKESYDAEDAMNHGKMNYIANEKVAQAAKESRDLIKAEIVRRTWRTERVTTIEEGLEKAVAAIHEFKELIGGL